MGHLSSSLEFKSTWAELILFIYPHQLIPTAIKTPILYLCQNYLFPIQKIIWIIFRMVNSSIILLLVSAVFGAEVFGNPSENEISLSGLSKGLIK